MDDTSEKLDPVQEEDPILDTIKSVEGNESKKNENTYSDSVNATTTTTADSDDNEEEDKDQKTVKREIHFSVGGSDGAFISLDDDEENDVGEGIEDLDTSHGSADDEDDEEWDKFEPSISDRLQIGYYRMDRACQSDETELISLKKLSELLAITTVDIKALKKNVYYAKLTLQAEYDGRLKDELTALQKRVTDRLAEIEKMHYEKIEVLRRSYRTQLANALCKLSCDYHRYYGKRDADSMEAHMKRVSDLEKQREEARKNEQREKDLAEMMRLQAEQAALEVVEERTPTPESIPESNTKYLLEIEELNENMVKYETKIDELENLLEETSEENKKINHELSKLTSRLTKEEDKTHKLKEQLSDLNQKLVSERYQAQERLNQQKEALKGEMDAKLNATREKMMNESSKQVEELKRKEAEKLHQMKMMEERKMKELMEQQQKEEVVVEVPEVPVLDHDTAALLQIQKSQKEEILALQKELNRKTKLWEMKIKILQEHIHVLKDEMFLRSTLQRQSARMKQAAITYTRHGACVQDVPLGVNPIDDRHIQRRHRLPTIVQSPSSKGVGKGTTVGTDIPVAQAAAADFCQCK